MIPFLGGFESTYQPAHDRDVLETNGHDRRWREDVALLRLAGVRALRYPIRWHRIERSPGRYDWRATDEVLEQLQAASYTGAARGAAAGDLPAYRWREPVATWLAGYLPHVRHREWAEAPSEACSNRTPDDAVMQLRARGAA